MSSEQVCADEGLMQYLVEHLIRQLMNIPVIKVGILSGAEIRFNLNGSYSLGENDNIRRENTLPGSKWHHRVEIHGLKSAVR